MRQLRPHLAEDEYPAQVGRLQAEQGYRLVVLFEDGQARAAAGYRCVENLAWGKSLYVDDLITDEASRSKGYAAKLFDWLEEEAGRSGCAMLHLDSGTQRHDAHRFYLNKSMKISAYHFDKFYRD